MEAPNSVRVFRSAWIERYLSRVHPALPAILWGPVAILSIAWGHHAGLSPARSLVLGVAGLLAWTLFEYILHRWVFHFIPQTTEGKRWWYPVHQIHHDVQEWDRLVAPPLLSLPLCAFFLTLFYGVFGTPTLWPFFGGFVLGYLAYDYVHLYTHFARPTSRLGKGLRRRHLQHHHAFPDRWYGVSSPLWDYVFRTHVRPGERPQRQAKEPWPRPRAHEEQERHG